MVVLVPKPRMLTGCAVGMELAGRDVGQPDARDAVDDLVDAGLGQRLDLLARHERGADVELVERRAAAGADGDGRQVDGRRRRRRAACPAPRPAMGSTPGPRCGERRRADGKHGQNFPNDERTRRMECIAVSGVRAGRGGARGWLGPSRIPTGVSASAVSSGRTIAGGRSMATDAVDGSARVVAWARPRQHSCSVPAVAGCWSSPCWRPCCAQAHRRPVGRCAAAHQGGMGQRLQEIQRDRKQRRGQCRRAPALVGASAIHGPS